MIQRWLTKLLSSAVIFFTVESAIAKFDEHNFLEKFSTITFSSINSFGGLSNDPSGNGAAAQFAMQGLGEFLNLTGIPAAMNGDYTLAAINAITVALPELKVGNLLESLNLTSKSMTVEKALTTGEQFLGAGYKEIGKAGSGVYRSADGLRQFRMSATDIAGSHGKIGSHVHFEKFGPTGEKLKNIHTPLIDP